MDYQQPQTWEKHMQLAQGLNGQHTMGSGIHFCPFCQGPRLPLLAPTPALGSFGPFHSDVSHHLAA